MSKIIAKATERDIVWGSRSHRSWAGSAGGPASLGGRVYCPSQGRVSAPLPPRGTLGHHLLTAATTFLVTMEKCNIPYRISKQGCHSHYQLQPSYLSQWALRELRREKSPCQLAAIRLQPLSMVSSEKGSLGRENTALSPQLAEVHMKGMISVDPDRCIFPYLEKC